MTDLTSKEIEVLQHIAAGDTFASIVIKLDTTLTAVNYYSKTIKAKLNAQSLPAAIATAVSIGVLDPVNYRHRIGTENFKKTDSHKI